MKTRLAIIIVAIGGAFGSLARYRVGKWIDGKTEVSFSIGTFLINISGAFLLGICMVLNMNNNLLLFLATGFLGAYTTFSTLLYEGYYLFKTQKWISVFYITGSVIFGILAFLLGIFLVNCF